MFSQPGSKVFWAREIKQGRQLWVASKRRQGGKVETYSDLVMGQDGAELALLCWVA
jgi:hypothetical protein